MLKILVNAYACSPNMGSEPGMGWNWCSHIAKYCELHIITEGEFRAQIEAELSNIPQGKNMHFYYLPVSDRVRKMCWNQGDWRFYYYYRRWQKRALIVGREICRQQSIDIIHQLNMIGFREPGLLWKINGPRYVWGPIGGLIDIPVNYLWKSSKKQSLKTVLKKLISALQIRYSSNVRRAVRRSDVLIGSTKDESNAMRKIYKREVLQVNETGTFVQKNKVEHCFQADSFNIIWVGRFILTKQLELALKTMAELKTKPQIKLHIVGTGTSEADYKTMADFLGLSASCIWYGQVDNQEVHRLMQNADLFLFTSVAEATSTVILEAISNGLPVLCFDACGMSSVISDDIGIKIPLTNPERSVRDFAEKIDYLYHHRERLVAMSENCLRRAEELSWDNKAREIVKLYNQSSIL